MIDVYLVVSILLGLAVIIDLANSASRSKEWTYQAHRPRDKQ